MRNLLQILLVLSQLCIFALQATTSPRGVSYYADFDSKLDKVVTISPPLLGNKQDCTAGTPVWDNDTIYLPVSVFYDVKGEFPNSTVVYAYNTVSNAITDSLILHFPGSSVLALNLVINGDIYLVGIRDSECIIYQLDRQLNIRQEFKTKIKASYISYAGITDSRLRVVCSSTTEPVIMYDLNQETMLVESSLALADAGFNKCRDGSCLYFFKALENSITGLGYDLAQTDPGKKDFVLNVSIPEFSPGKRFFTCKVAGSSAYFSYIRSAMQTGSRNTFITANMIDGNSLLKEVESPFSFDIIDFNGKTFIYRTQPFMSNTALQVSELTPDLQETNPRVSFMFSDSNRALSIVHGKDNKVLLTGTYKVNNGKQSLVKSKDYGKFMLDEKDAVVFLGILDLK